MTKENRVKIFLVDDDAVFLKSMEIEFLQKGDFIIETFATGELCVKSLANAPDVIILDYYLDGIDKDAMNGIATLDKIKGTHPDIPVVMLSAQDKIEVAVECMHHHALDYVIKSETAFTRLQKIITDNLHSKKLEKTVQWYMDRV